MHTALTFLCRRTTGHPVSWDLECDWVCVCPRVSVVFNPFVNDHMGFILDRLTSSQLNGVLQYPIRPCCPTIFTWWQSCSRDKRRKKSCGKKTLGKIMTYSITMEAVSVIHFPFKLNWLITIVSRDSASFYLTYHSSVVPHSRSVIHSNWLDVGRGQEDTSEAPLSEQRHTSEQVGCRAVQGELDLQA